MKKKLRTAKKLAVLLILIGLFVAAFPFVSQNMYSRKAQRQIAQLESRVKQNQAPVLEELKAQMQQYNRQIFEEKQANLQDPFSYRQMGFSLANFGFAEEMVGNIEIPSINLTLPVYLGASEENLNKGAALLGQTSFPIGGESTNAVIAAHRGLARANMFRHIDKIALGDTVFFTNFWQTLQYQVEDISIVEPADKDSILIRPGQDYITLLSCHPYGKNTQRYIVYCKAAAP